jgi:hypothetical protein
MSTAYAGLPRVPRLVVPEIDDDGRFLLDLEELADARRFHSLDCTCDSDPLGRCVVHNDVDAEFEDDLHAALARGYAKPTDSEELARQARIAAGEEHACAGCGCSETRACEGGCVWATETLCSRCI